MEMDSEIAVGNTTGTSASARSDTTSNGVLDFAINTGGHAHSNNTSVAMSTATLGKPPIAAQTFAIRRQNTARPLVQLSMELIHTYNTINHNYYKKRKPPHDGAVLRKKKGLQKDAFDYEVSSEDEILDGRYRVCGKEIGKGSFGVVVEAVDIQTQEKVAIKIVKKKKSFTTQAQMEIAILESLQRHNHPGRNMVVKLLNSFVHKGHQCLVFELLSYNLLDLLKSTGFKGISFNLLRKIIRQILQVLDYLAHPSVNIIHCDLKPENVLLVHPKHSNLKLIDFGSSCLSQKQMYQYIQSRFYRSPEVILGMSYTVAIDMWSLGCIMVEMHTGKPLFAGVDQYDQLLRITNTLGMPPRDLIAQANPLFRAEYFDEIAMVEGDNKLTEYRMKMRKSPNRKYRETSERRSLRDILGVDIGGPEGRRRDDPVNHPPAQYAQLLDLVQRMLDYNPATRITPAEALRHPFMNPGVTSSARNEKKSKCMRSNRMSDVSGSESDYRFDGGIPNRAKQRRLYSNANDDL